MTPPPSETDPPSGAGVTSPPAPGAIAGDAGGSGTATIGAASGGHEKRSHRGWVEWGIILALAVVIAILVRTFVFETYYIPSGSMIPTLEIGDRIVVNKLAYDFHSVHTGDIIVFARPPKEDCPGPPVADLVKRVIGLPGQRISSSGNTVLINGKPLPEPWLPKGEPLGPPITPMTIPPNSYYVLGDNRPNSCDSRYWGVVPKKLIVGKVDAIIWPLSQIKFF
ncbi:MAG: signal peptidase I [Actinomycetota bacterium]|nr:signal peptidase I [Actinomycetota bacterium]